MAHSLLIGLGNPGKKHAHQRHNIGFMVANAMHEHFGFSPWKNKFQGELADGTIAGNKTTLLKPQTFMNLSGESAGQVTRFYKIAPEQVCVIHDELDLPLGKIRVKQGGGHGGHNGLKSLDSHVGKNYWRVRVGIGHPGDKDMVSPYVLSDFAKAEQQMVDEIIHDITTNIDLLLEGNETEFMNRVSMASNNSAP